VKAFVRLNVALLALLAGSSLYGGDLPTGYADGATFQDVIARYQNATQVQREALKGVQMEVDIDASLPKLEKSGTYKVLRMIPKVGQITFKQIRQFIGDQTVWKEVIVRYLETEQQERENGSLAISPENYNFKGKAIITENGQSTYIFDVKPKHKAVGLFKGELWLDGATGMPLKEEGQLVKNPSVWLKSVKFVRDYQILDGIAVVKHFESVAQVRLFGRAELKADFSNVTWQDSEESATPVGP
jgi:hypothetical protein